jgi:hypothetical protein
MRQQPSGQLKNSKLSTNKATNQAYLNNSTVYFMVIVKIVWRFVILQGCSKKNVISLVKVRATSISWVEDGSNKLLQKMARWNNHCCGGEAKTPSMYAVDIHDTVKNTKTLTVAQQYLRGECTSLSTIQSVWASCKLPR